MADGVKEIAKIQAKARAKERLEAEADNLDQDTKAKEQQTLKLAEELAEVKANVARIEEIGRAHV